jgi:MATE family multidrug resistance protein
MRCIPWGRRWREQGGERELLQLALPLILSNGFLTLQVTLDRIMLSRLDSDAVGAVMPAVMLFWTAFALIQNTANYATTFVAQYVGAGRPRRVGPAVWQGVHFSVLGGFAFLLLLPFAEVLMAWGAHSERLQVLEVAYFRCLCFAALPMAITAAASSFFAGRGDTWTVLLINAVGMVVNGLLGYAWIFGRWGFDEWGIVGAGWALVAGSAAAALVAMGLMLRRRYREEFATLEGWRPELGLFARLMRFGLPNGLQWSLDGLAFTAFLFLVGRLGEAELAATSIACTLNLIAFLPTMGIAQAVGVLVGQRLGQDRPDLAERSGWTGFRLGWLCMTAVAVLYVLTPDVLMAPFQSSEDPAKWARVAALVPELLCFVAVYCLFDSMTLVFSFALRGAGDTRFVTAATLTLSWPLMVLPVWVVAQNHWSLGWAWLFATIYIIILALLLLARFRQGQWKTMRVIEAMPPEESAEMESDVPSMKPAVSQTT